MHVGVLNCRVFLIQLLDLWKTKELQNMQIFVRGAAELLPLELEKEDTVQDIRVSDTLIPLHLWER